MLGKPVPDSFLASTGDSPFSLSSARGKKLVLYFCPQDRGRAATRMHFPIELLSDRAEAACERLGVMKSGHVQEVLNFAKAL